MRKYLLVILTLLVWPTGLAAKPLVVLVSIDGFRPDYLKRGNSPVLDGSVDGGASAKGLIAALSARLSSERSSEWNWRGEWG
jgi:hypothetical protein